MMTRRLIALLTGVSLSLSALAAQDARAEESSVDRAKEKEVAQRVKRRQYPGGPDESDLKVQNPLPTPVRKMAPSVEDEKSESATGGGGTED